MFDEIAAMFSADPQQPRLPVKLTISLVGVSPVTANAIRLELDAADASFVEEDTTGLVAWFTRDKEAAARAIHDFAIKAERNATLHVDPPAADATTTR